MKKTLEDELMGLAHRILKLKGREDIEELKKLAGLLHEKLSILSFAEKHFAGPQPSLGMSEVENALFEKGIIKAEDDANATETEVEEKAAAPQDSMEVKSETTFEEPEKDPEIPVAHLEEDTEVSSETHSESEASTPEVDLREISVHFDELPLFEPLAQTRFDFEEDAVTEEEQKQVKASKSQEEKPEVTPKSKSRNQSMPPKRSLNQSLNHGLKFSLNDKITFTNHLFAGNSIDFERVVSQLNTFKNYSEAKIFIEEHVRPDYDWTEKEVHAERFLQILETKMEA